MAFELSSHEVMRGIKVRDGRLVLRPAGTAMAADVFQAVVLTFAATPIVIAGWWMLGAPAAYLVLDKLAGLRTAVVADAHRVSVQNRWTRRQITFSDVREATSVEATWWWRRPVLIGISDDGIGWAYLLGAIVDRRGKTYWCDAVVSGRAAAEGGIVDPPPAEMKMAALERWIDDHRAPAST